MLVRCTLSCGPGMVLLAAVAFSGCDFAPLAGHSAAELGLWQRANYLCEVEAEMWMERNCKASAISWPRAQTCRWTLQAVVQVAFERFLKQMFTLSPQLS